MHSGGIDSSPGTQVREPARIDNMVRYVRDGAKSFREHGALPAAHTNTGISGTRSGITIPTIVSPMPPARSSMISGTPAVAAPVIPDRGDRRGGFRRARPIEADDNRAARVRSHFTRDIIRGLGHRVGAGDAYD